MSLIKSSSAQIGQNGTATQNFTLTQGADGTFTLARGNAGATTQDVLTIDANGLITANQGIVTNRLVSGTAIATTSGTSIDFTSIPSWVTRIMLTLNGVSTSGSSSLIVQSGAGSVETSGYTGAVSFLATSTLSTAASGTTGYQVANAFAGGQNISGHIVLTLVSSNIWALSATLANDGGTAWVAGGTKSLSGTLDRIRLTTVGGSDTFDAGSVNIMYEG